MLCAPVSSETEGAPRQSCSTLRRWSTVGLEAVDCAGGGTDLENVAGSDAGFYANFGPSGWQASGRSEWKSWFSSADQPWSVDDRTPVAWRDLRDWLKLVEQAGQLKRIDAPVDPDEELGAITFMAGRNTDTPALLFNNLVGNRTDARILSNMLGASKERYALAVGLDPDASTSDLIMASRDLMKRRLAPVHIAKSDAPVNEIVEQGDDIDITQFPSPKFWPGDGGRYIGTGDITFTRDPETGRINVGVYRQMVHGPARVGLYCSPGKHGRLDREAWWARGKPCEVVAAYGIDPVLFMVGAQVFSADQSELDVAGGIMGRAGRADGGRACQPADPGQCRAGDRGTAARRRHRDGRPARRVHRLLRRRARQAAGDRDQGGPPAQIADHHRGADGDLSVVRDRRLLRDHALGAHSRRPAAHRRSRRGVGLFASGRGFGLGHGDRVAQATICRPRRPGAGAWRRNVRRRPTTPSG